MKYKKGTFIIVPKLNKEQSKHLKSLQWLFSEDLKERRSGRTLLLAWIYIDIALKGGKVNIIDHAYITTSAGYRVNKMLAEYIKKIIDDNDLPLIINYTNLTLYLK